MSGFSQKLKQLRWSQNMSMRQFAESLGINPNTYKQYDSGYRKPTIKLLKQLFWVYDIDLNEWILEMEND